MRPVRLLALTALLLAFQTPALAVMQIPATPPPVSQPPSSQPKAKNVAPAVTAPALPAMRKDAVLKRGRQLIEWFYAQNLDPVWTAFLPTARADFGGDLVAFKAYRAMGVTTYGKESRLISEEVQQGDGVTYYLRTATFERGPKVLWTLAFGLNAQGQVVTFGILGGTEPAPDKQATGRQAQAMGRQAQAMGKQATGRAGAAQQ